MGPSESRAFDRSRRQRGPKGCRGPARHHPRSSAVLGNDGESAVGAGHARPWTRHARPWTRHARPWTRHARPWTRHARPWTRHARPWTRHARPWTRHARPWTRHARPWTRHARPWTRHARPWTRHARPWTRHARPLAPDTRPLRRSPRSQLVLFHLAVADGHHAMRIQRDIVLVSHQHDRVPLLVERIEQGHNLIAGGGVQIARGLVS